MGSALSHLASDSDKVPHVGIEKYKAVLQEQLGFLEGSGIDVQIDTGLFSSSELQSSTSPETRIQILLSDTAELDAKKNRKYHEKNIYSLPGIDSTCSLRH